MDKKAAYMGIASVLVVANAIFWTATHNWWALLIANIAMIGAVLLGKRNKEKEIAKIEAGPHAAS